MEHLRASAVYVSGRTVVSRDIGMFAPVGYKVGQRATVHGEIVAAEEEPEGGFVIVSLRVPA